MKKKSYLKPNGTFRKYRGSLVHSEVRILGTHMAGGHPQKQRVTEIPNAPLNIENFSSLTKFKPGFN
jgi:hypothetical protein